MRPQFDQDFVQYLYRIQDFRFVYTIKREIREEREKKNFFQCRETLLFHINLLSSFLNICYATWKNLHIRISSIDNILQTADGYK